MGYWENTAYINSPSTKEVIEELTSMFADEGMVLVPSPHERKSQYYEPMQYATALKNDLWGIAVFPGNENWVVIKTAPLELLGEKEPNENRIRFVLLCSRLNCSGFMYNLYDSGPEILIETDGTGQYKVTGYGYNDPLDYYGEKLDESFFEIQFTLLPYQYILEKYSCGDDRANAFAEEFGGKNMRYCDNLTSVETLICHKPLQANCGEALYYKWPKKGRVDIDSCSREEWKNKNG